MKLGDLVVRKSYGGDVIFKIQQMEQSRAVITGVDFRLLADSPVTDLQRVTETRPAVQVQSQLKVNESLRELQRYRTWQRERNQAQWTAQAASPHEHTFFEMPGKVLHLDGDANYLRKSMMLYSEFRVPAEGFFVTESDMPQALYRLLPQVRPNIVVVTGHDGILKNLKEQDISNLSSYKHSHHFVKAVKIARDYEKNFDGLTVIAGACQSHFEALLQAGANFASSPGRVLIHALDPSCIAIKSAFTSVKETVDVIDVINNTISGIQGVGGIETRGSYRIGLPRMKPGGLAKPQNAAGSGGGTIPSTQQQAQNQTVNA
ncbi:sporulation peptidase YabG [Paenibacillus koleovorans]|uniref:sporulation peptidase YabG n=1 Tax=Paenibacillus koleovorans TaxID=121608 RepID=UPI000FD9FA4D|nr:sporulation peptidase YabG [Paenibacillus koleovorans]